MTRQYVVGELSVILGELQAAATNTAAADDAARLRYEAEASGPGQLAEVAARLVAAEDAQEHDLSAQAGGVGRSVGGPTGAVRPGLQFDDGDGGLRGDTADGALKVDVQHQVADHQDTPPREAFQEWCQGPVAHVYLGRARLWLGAAST